ncbi:Homeodomain-like protein [Gigaspora rosea]|uniref:Homeodomain-like protein n=1 Tax=Gigaspora rosea TaxID=44941 RepID=A0A397UL89_9GLOM|nr:Homeodomain-like protein [Gigaspora rosea]
MMLLPNEEIMMRVNKETTLMKENKKRSNEEDRKLIELVGKYGARKWGNIAKLMGTRSAKQCRERWDSHLKPGIQKANSIPFSSREEETIWRSRAKGVKWSKIALLLGNGRTANDIKNAYNQRICKQKHTQIMMSIYRIIE